MMITMRAACLRSCSLSVLLIIGGATLALAQNDPDTSPAAMTMFPHPGDSRWWLSGQVNLIWQTHGQFTSPYQGDNSLRPEPEQALSSVWTIYAGVRLRGHMELLLDIESAGGRGLSDALGLAGFTNLDVVRNPTLGAAPYVARAMVHVTVPFSQDMVAVTPTAFSLAPRVSARRLDIRAGKLTFEAIMHIAEGLIADCDRLKRASALPETCELTWASSLLRDLTSSWERRMS